MPQGSILGPLFFILYINDVASILGDIDIGLYTDDTVLFTHDPDWLKAQNELQSTLDQLINWCDKNELTVNLQKTKFMIFGSRSRVKRAKNSKLFIKGTSIQQVPSFKYLGFSMDSVLSFSNHISSLF